MAFPSPAGSQPWGHALLRPICLKVPVNPDSLIHRQAPCPAPQVLTSKAISQGLFTQPDTGPCERRENSRPRGTQPPLYYLAKALRPLLLPGPLPNGGSPQGAAVGPWVSALSHVPGRGGSQSVVTSWARCTSSGFRRGAPAVPPTLAPRSPMGSWAPSTVLSSRTHGVTSVPLRGCKKMASKGRVIS